MKIGCAADAAEGAGRAVDAAGNELVGAAKSFGAAMSIHLCSFN